MQLVRDLLDQLLRDPDGNPAGRVDDFSIRVEEDGIYVESVLTGGGILADDLGALGRACEHVCRLVRRRPLRRASIPWSDISEVAEHALTIAHAPTGIDGVEDENAGIRLRATRRVRARSADGVRLHLLDLEVADPRPGERVRVAGLLMRRRHRLAWPISLRPRQRSAARDWRFVEPDDLHVAPGELVIERRFEDLAPARESSGSHPPKRRPWGQS